MERERYPADWKQIAASVKTNAGWKCQNCGRQCRKPGEPFDTHKRTLTVAHLNHTPEDVRPENLMAMCAPCHLRYDAQHHADSYTPVQILSVKLITPCKNVLVKCKGCRRFVDLSETAMCPRCGKLVETEETKNA